MSNITINNTMKEPLSAAVGLWGRDVGASTSYYTVEAGSNSEWSRQAPFGYILLIRGVNDIVDGPYFVETNNSYYVSSKGITDSDNSKFLVKLTSLPQ